MPAGPGRRTTEGAIDSAVNGEEWTPHDSNELPQMSRAIAIAEAGAVCVVYADGTEHTIPSGVLAAGILHPLKVKAIKATGTDASVVSVFY